MTRKLSVSFFRLLCTSAKSFRSEACLRSKIASLKTSTNGPVHLFYFRDIESFEADILGIYISASKTRLHRARLALKKTNRAFNES